jgi:uncharacterized protein (DUF1330 family)
MTAYVILDVEVTDPEGYKEYVKLAPEAVKLYGGKYIARGGQTETLEGKWQAKRLVILEFPSTEQAKNWLYSSEYAAARALRHQYARTNMVVVEGVQL